MTGAVMLDVDGYEIRTDVISRRVTESLLLALETPVAGDSLRARRGRAYAMRDLLKLVPAARELAESAAIRVIVEPSLGSTAKPVRGILFDKTPNANWKVAWHQDLSIAVKEKRDAKGYGPWSVKAGVQHVQPPVEILRRMLTVRVHLDDCDEDNGPLQVLPGSHADGVLNAEAIRIWRDRIAAVACLVPAGGAMLMRPLLLHASSPAMRPAHRRVIHLEYAAAELVGGIQWYET